MSVFSMWRKQVLWVNHHIIIVLLFNLNFAHRWKFSNEVGQKWMTLSHDYWHSLLWQGMLYTPLWTLWLSMDCFVSFFKQNFALTSIKPFECHIGHNINTHEVCRVFLNILLSWLWWTNTYSCILTFFSEAP